MTKWYEFTDYITPDGLTYHFRTHEKFLISETGFGMSPIEYITQKGPMQHGETIYDYRLKPRTIQMVIAKKDCSREEYWESRANILNYLRPNRQTTSIFSLGRLVKRRSDGSKRAIDVIIEEGPTFDSQGDDWDKFYYMDTIRFIAPDPTFYDPTIVTRTWTVTPDVETHLVFPFTFDGVDMYFRMASLITTDSVTYGGGLATWPSFPTIVITGPINHPIISNTSTGETITLTYNIAASEVVTITLQYGSKTVSSSVYGNIIGTVESPSDLATFHIAPAPEVAGGVNAFSIFGSDASAATSVVMTYYTRYIGI